MSDVDDFTELVDFVPDRVDLVGKAANGTEILVAKAEGEPVGLFEPDFVRELVAKADAEERATPVPQPVTLSGSPAAVADLMRRVHGAPVRKAEAVAAEPDQVVKSAGEYAAVVKAKYSAEDKRRLLAQGHAMRNADGEPDYPIDDAEDLGRAIHAVGRGGADHDKIRKYVMRRAREMGKPDQIPDNWAADGSLKQPVAKALVDGTGMAADPGSPSWEAQDAASAQQVIDQILAVLPSVKALAQREGAEVGNGHMDDLQDICDLQSVQDALMCAAKTLGGFAVSEHAEATASVAKAQDPAPAPAAPAAPVIKENAVSETQTASQAGTETVAKAEGVLSAAERAAIELEVRKEIEADQLREQIRKAARGAAAQTSGADPAPTDARTVPGIDTAQAPARQPGMDDVAKAQATDLVAALQTALAPVVKQVGDLATQVNAQQERVEKAMRKPDDRNSPVLNGATGLLEVAERDHAGSPVRSPEFQAVQKALNELPEGETRDAARAAVGIAAIKARFGHA